MMHTNKPVYKRFIPSSHFVDRKWLRDEVNNEWSSIDCEIWVNLNAVLLQNAILIGLFVPLTMQFQSIASFILTIYYYKY